MSFLARTEKPVLGFPLYTKCNLLVISWGTACLCVFDLRAGEQEAISIKKRKLLFQQCVFLILPVLCWLHLLWDSLQRKESLQSAHGVTFQIPCIEREFTVRFAGPELWQCCWLYRLFSSLRLSGKSTGPCAEQALELSLSALSSLVASLFSPTHCVHSFGFSQDCL